MKKLLIGLLLLAFPTLVLAATVTQIYGTNDTLLSVVTNITNGAGVIGSEVPWTSAGYLRADCELNVPSLSGTVTANTGATVWLVIKPDAANYEDGSATVFPARMPDMFFPMRNVSTAQRITLKDIPIPVGPVTAVLRNDSGVTFQGATSTFTLKCRPRTFSIN